MNRTGRNYVDSGSRSGIVLMITLVLLVILSILGYMLVSRVSAQKHRDQYIIDYQSARYACDSGIKYALVALTDIDASKLISRPNEPDFSDLFCLNDDQYNQLLADWARQKAMEKNQSGSDANTAGNLNDSNNIKDSNKVKDSNIIKNLNDIKGLDALTDLNNIGDLNGIGEANGLFTAAQKDANVITIRGPYGPVWPYVSEPLEFQIGSVNVRIEIEDENAKYPLGWPLLDDKENEKEAKASLETFCEWMKMDRSEIDDLESQLKQIADIKKFSLDFQTTQAAAPQQPAPATSTRVRRTRGQRRPAGPTALTPVMHMADFANLFHSSFIDLNTLAKPTIVGTNREESALKYMGLWASSAVNINTAPRNVLEAAFTFGGDADKIADEIIKQRRIKPFKDVKELENSKTMLKYSTSIKKCEKYITAVSVFFTIRVTATSGVARACSIIAVTKADKKMQKIAVLSN